jgi:hypothetical protein
MAIRKRRPGNFSQAATLVIDMTTGQVEDRPPTPEGQCNYPAAATLGGRAARHDRGRPRFR